MKKLITILAFVVLTITLKGQMVLEHTYNITGGRWFQYTTLTKAGVKYFQYDNSKLYLYNLDHSIYKTISLKIPSGFTLSYIFYVSDHLFNNDDKIEYLADYHKTGADKIQVENEDGNILNNIDQDGFPGFDIVKTANNTYKLIVGTINVTQTQVYSLPGTMEKSGELKSNKDEIGNPYPNPTKSNIVIPYELPENTNEATLSIYTLDGKEIRQYTVGKMFDNFILNTSDMMKGIYLYNINGKNFNSEMKKFIVE